MKDGCKMNYKDKELLEYLQQILDANAQLEQWKAGAELNLQIKDKYIFYKAELLDTIFFIMKPRENMTVQTIKAQMEYIRCKWNCDSAVLLEESSAYRIKKMLEERIPFIVMNGQMYLPFMALHLKKKTQKETGDLPQHFTAATQLLYLYLLYREDDLIDMEELVKALGMSVMTVSRGMEKLEQIGVVNHEITGKTRRKKLYKRIDRKDYYLKGIGYLENPVRHCIYVKEIPKNLQMYKSGLSALAEQSMLGEPMHEIYAISGKQEKILRDFQVGKEQAMEEHLPEIQIMKYNIGLLGKEGCVDPITLIKSLDETDERIELAIEEMMEGEEWFVE